MEKIALSTAALAIFMVISIFVSGAVLAGV